MKWYGWVILIGVVWFVWSRRTKKVSAFSAFDQIEPWLREHGLDPSQVNFSSYSGYRLGRNPGSTIIIGVSDRQGFAVEVDGGKVIDSALIGPGPASYHAAAARDAQMTGRTLIDHLVERDSRRVRA